MTQLARNGYRRHRKASWGFALLFALAVGAILIPFASGAGGKTYTLGLNPAAQCASGTDGATSTVLTLKDTSNSQGLGSAELLFPANSVYSSSLGTVNSNQPGTPYDAGNADVIGPLNNLNLSPGGSVPITVTFKAGSHTGPVEAVVKQANQFNDAGGGANLFANPSTWPQLAISTCTLAFVQQPPQAWQKATQASSPVSVALEAGGTPVASPGLNPSLAATLESPAAGTVDFAFGAASYNAATNVWSWPDAVPASDTTSGTYHLVASATGQTSVNSNSFRVDDGICPAGQKCPYVDTNTGPNGEGAGAIGINNTLSGDVALDFIPVDGNGGQPQTCGGNTWNRAFYFDSNGTAVYFPSIQLNLAPVQGKVLQITYLVRNSEWVQTSASRGNNDIEFCVSAHHSNPALNGPLANAFATKYGATWDGTDYTGVLTSVANPSKTTNSPVVCNRGTVSRPTGPNGASETWRTWTVCIPYDWDFRMK